MHELIQGNKNAIEQYYMSYPVIDDRHVNEAIKLELLSQKALAVLPPYGQYEVALSTSDYIGFIDMLVENDDGTYDIWDFKYSNSIENYMRSAQLHLYKYYIERTGLKVRHLRYLFIPKVKLRQKQTENLFQFRKRLIRAIQNDYQVTVKEVEYNPNEVIAWLTSVKHVLEAKDFPLNKSDPFWKYSEFYDYIEKGHDYMVLPKAERRELTGVNRKKVWIYGAPFTGKTTFANEFPMPLMLNTDGNIKFVDAPYVAIKDEIEIDGRRSRKIFAWEIFKNTLDELEENDNEFKTIVVDLVEDVYEFCRLYMYDKLGIDHESDDPYRAWDKVRTEFLSNMNRLMNLDYDNIVLISHEDKTRDFTKKNGVKFSTVAPNLQEKVATKLSGMVDVVARMEVNEEDSHVLSFKTSPSQFGGGRLKITKSEIPSDYEDLCEVFEDSLKSAKSKRKQTSLETVEAEEEKPKKRTRKTKKVEESSEEPAEDVESEETEVEQTEVEEPTEEQSKPRRRKRRSRTED